MTGNGRIARLQQAAGIALCVVGVLLSIHVALSQAAPTVASASVSGTTLTITFSETLADSSSAVASDFTVKLGEESRTVSSASIDGSAVALTLMEAVPDVDCTDESVKVSYSATGSTLTGSGGGAVAAFEGQAVTNNTDNPPAIESAETDETGRYIYVTFCEPIADLSYLWANFSAFSILVNGDRRSVDDLLRRSDSPDRLDIRLSRRQAIKEGDTVTLAYDQSSGDEDYPLRDLDQGQLLVSSWSVRSVINHVDGPPTLRSISSAYEIVTLTFSEALDEDSVPDPDAFSIAGIQHPPGVDEVSIAGNSVTLTLDNILHNRNSPTYTLTYSQPNDSALRQVDGMHNVADISAFEFESGTPDTNPTVSALQVDGAELTIDFDLPLRAVAPASAFSIAGDREINVTASSFTGSTVTLTLSPAVSAGAAVTLSYSFPDAPPRIEGRNRRDADGFSNKAVTNNTTAPQPRFSQATVSTDGAELAITFSIALDPTSSGVPSSSAFSLAGTSASISSVSVAGSSVTLGMSPAADVDETITVSYTPPSDSTDSRLRSLDGAQPVEALANQPVTNNADGKPRSASASLDRDEIQITFDRALDGESLPAASSFTIGGSSSTVSSVAIGSRLLTLTVTPALTHLDTITIDYHPPAQMPLKRTGRSLLVDGFTGQPVTNITENPTPMFVSASTDATGRTLTVLMSQPLMATAGGVPAASTFTLSGTTQASIDAVAVVGSSLLLTLAPAADINETITVSYSLPTDSAASALKSADGLWSTPAWADKQVSNGADGVPRPLRATGNSDLMVIRFDRALDESSIPPASNFSVSPSDLSVSKVEIGGVNATLTLSDPLAYDDIVAISYSASDSVKLKRDGLALTVGAFRGFEVKNNTPEPLLRSVVGDETTILLAFTKTLDTTVMPDATAFSLGSDQPTVTAVTVARTTVTLTLDGTLKEGAEYTLTYTVPTTTPLTTSDSSAVPAFSKSVSNNTDVAPRVDAVVGEETTLTITFDQALDSTASIAVSYFSLTGEFERTLSAVEIDGSSVSLTLSSALKEDEAASVRYTKPGQGGIADSSGNRTDSFDMAIDNQTDTAPVPILGQVDDDTITILLDQELYADPRFGLKDGYPTEHFTLSGTDATIDFVLVSNGGPEGVGKIQITLSRTIRTDETLSITYLPTSGSIRIRDDDAGKHRAQINNFQLQYLDNDPPVVVSASLDGESLSVTFDETVDAVSQTLSTAFELSPDGPVVESLSVTARVLTLGLATRAEEDKEYTLSYTPPASNGLSDPDGNLSAAFTVSVDNVTDYAPFPTLMQTDVAGERVYVTFDQRIDPEDSIDPSRFSLEPSADLHSVVIDPDEMSGTRLRLILTGASRIAEGVSLRLTYQRPEEGGLRDDDAGNLVESFSGEVDNVVDVAPAVERATVDRDTLTIEFDQELNPDHVPPANCDDFETPEDRAACHEDPDILWFEVFRHGTEALELKSVTLSGSTVTILLAIRVAKTDEIRVGYSRKSLEGSRFNLRDTSSPGNHVETFDPLLVANLTAAAALQGNLDRREPDQISVEFDAELSSDASEITSMVSVLVGGVSVPVQSAHTSGSLLDLRLIDQIPECADVSFAYAPGESPLLDADARQVVGFELEVVNLIDAVWGLKCVHSDLGSLVWAFDESGVPDRMGFEWSLSVNGEERAVEVEAADPVIRLVPDESICQGDSIEVRYSNPDEADALVLVRTITRAAPCVISAVADGVTLTVSFDSPLDGAMPDAAEFSVGGAVVEAVDGISGGVLTLRLTGPGIRAGQTAALTYSGSRLMGSGLTVGAFVVEISDLTAAPELTSALGIDSSIFLNFDQPLIARSVPASRFIVSIPGIELEVKSVSVSGSSVYLELSESLPDDPDLFGLIYLARDRGGLAGLTGARVGNSVFIVQNYTETRPTVASAEVDSLEVVLTFDQPVVANGASAADFSVIAGRRTIGIESLGWSSERLTMSLSERVTSLDAVWVRYAPTVGREVRDSSNLALEAFQLRAENRTADPSSVSQRVEDAKLRAGGGETTVERELARGFAADDGIRFSLDGSKGRRTVVRGDLRVTVDVGQGDERIARIDVARIDELESMLAHVESAPASCWDADDASTSAAWWIGVSDRRGVPSDLSLRISMAGIGRGFQPRSACVLDLKSGEWSFLGADGRVTGPALLLTREAPPTFSWDRLSLAG